MASQAGVLSQFHAGLDGSSDFDHSPVLCAPHSSQEAPPQGDRNQKWRILVQSLLLAFYRPLQIMVSTPAGGAEVRTSLSRVPLMAEPFVLTPSALFLGQWAPCLPRALPGQAGPAEWTPVPTATFIFIAATVLVNTWHGTLLLIFEPLGNFRMESSLAWLVRAFIPVSWSLSWARQLATRSCASSLCSEHDHAGPSPEPLVA